MTVLGEQLISIVRAKAAESPGNIYIAPVSTAGTCVYVHQGKPSCIIGHALWGAGLIDATFPDAAGGRRMFPLNEEGLSVVVQQLDIDLSDEEIMWLSKVQWEQDRGTTWGNAVFAADAKFPVPA